MPIEKRRIFFNNRKTLKNTSHIEYKLQCEWCTKEYWSMKINGKFCSNSCRQANFVAQKK